VSPETLAFLEAVRDVEGPTTHTEERVLRNVRRAIATGAIAGACVEAPWFSKTWLSGGVLKGGYLALCLVAAGTLPGSQVTGTQGREAQAALRIGSSESEPRVPEAGLLNPAVLSADVPTVEPNEARHEPTPTDVNAGLRSVAPKTAHASRKPSPSSAANATAAPPHPPSVPSASLMEELLVLSHVQAALKRGDGAEALRLLNERLLNEPRLNDPIRGGTQLLPERDAARVLALCATGQRAEAHTAATLFARRHPTSLQLSVVRRSCAGANLNDDDQNIAPR
jgi:hypothetical protein